jgi:hypothetical protein
VEAAQHSVDPSERYTGPEFDEYCISEGKYLPASRDRTPCTTCPLGDLCQAGFEEQVRRVVAGENPSLTECKTFAPESLTREALLKGLSDEAARFVQEKVFDVIGGAET